MTIASEITRINGNIAAAYTALSNKGATMPATQNSNNLATTVASVPSGGGDTVTAINYTAGAITAGQKVWLNKKANVTASSVNAAPDTYGPYKCFVDPSGTSAYSYYDSAFKYDISEGTRTSGGTSMGRTTQIYFPQYDSHSNLFYWHSCINGSTTTDINLICTQDDYAITASTSSDATFTLNKVDKDNSFAVTQSWTVNTYSLKAANSRYYCVIGDKIYCDWDTYHKIGTIGSSASFNMDNRSDSNTVMYSTSDNKVAIVTSGAPDILAAGLTSVKLVNVNNDYTLGTDFVSANSELNNMLGKSGLWVSFNRVTGVLCICEATNYGAGHYGIFKYENNDFTTLAITLDNSDSVTVMNWYTLTVSTDLSLVQYANVLYKLEQVADGTYKAIPYSYAMGQQTLTGVAAENAAAGASFEATTIIPE